MDHPKEFQKLIQEIMDEDPEPTLIAEEIDFEVEVIKILELV